jgi:hypothetical protein
MSPSKLRKLAAYGEGRAAFHTAEVRDPTPNPYADTRFYDKREAWSLGWEEEKAEWSRPPEPMSVEEALAITADQVRARREKTGASMPRCKAEVEKEALEAAVELVTDMDDVRLILRKLVERIHVPNY